MGISLYEHNQAAYNAAVQMLSEHKKAAVIHPTGTGKSFIAFKLCEENYKEKICWLSPSEYIFKTQLENIKKTAPEFKTDNITFITYAKLMNMNDDEVSRLKPSYIILDEFHRCGAYEWGKGVECLLKKYSKAAILGLSATAIRYLDNQRNMADELFDGNIASEMTLGEAIVRGILAKPTYIVSMYSYQKELERYESKIKHKKYSSVCNNAEKYLEKLRRTLEMADGVKEILTKHIKEKNGKYIVFCASVEHLKEMIALAPEWFDGIDKEPHIYKTFADDTEASRDFIEFKADNSEHLKLLYCVDMLNEGIHVEGVSGVILLRPTISPIVYKQQIGRALSASGKKEPIIFDIVNNFENLYSISAVEEEMNVAMTYYRSSGQDRLIINDRFEVIDEIRNCKDIFGQLEETLSTPWDVMYLYAKRYFENNGDLEVPRRYKTEEGYALGNWITTQRKVYNGTIYGELGKERIKKLDDIGMRWEYSNKVSWDKFYTEAKAYFEKNGDLNININYLTPTGYPLGKRIHQIRSYRKSGIKNSFITEERIVKLDQLGMIWSTSDYIWEKNYEAALGFYKKNGHLDIPLDFIAENGVKAGVWIRNIRNLRMRKSPYFTLTETQIKMLDEIDMLWSSKYARLWERGFCEAKKYYGEYGDLDVPATYISKSGFKLGGWISHQREKSKNMEPERREYLDSIGMLWEKDDPWEVRFAFAKRFFEENGHLDIPQSYKPSGIWMGKWINEQKQTYYGNRKGKELTVEQISRLESIGMDWRNLTERIWDENYIKAKTFYETNGHLNIPTNMLNLYRWLKKQKERVLLGEMSKEKEKLLFEIGMVLEEKKTG